jgi:hypothetical protein
MEPKNPNTAGRLLNPGIGRNVLPSGGWLYHQAHSGELYAVIEKMLGDAPKSEPAEVSNFCRHKPVRLELHFHSILRHPAF